MKRIIPLLLCFMFLFSACGKQEQGDNHSLTETENNIHTQEERKETFIASWLSFYELSVTKERNTREKYKEYILELFENMASVCVTDVFVHVRPYADALYKSSYFPTSVYASGEQGKEADFDILEVITECGKERNIKIHAWINPYRVSSQKDITKLCKDNAARIWYEEENGNTVVGNEGIYFNPASLQVQKLILDGVKEIMENYDVAGIHIDDYFYCEDMGDFDKESYEKYLDGGGELSLVAFRQENVNSLVSSLYITVKSYGEDKLFSVSPSADIEKCLEIDCADVKLWCETEGYCDIIIPQIYYGFENEKMPFSECLQNWSSLCQSGKTKLVIGLGLYKSGQEDIYALSGKNEWIENGDIIARQVQEIYSENCYGFALYSGTYINFSETFLSEQLNYLKSMVY